ncbi:MAG: glycosyltransferase family 2 protein [Acidobacteriota bacterium]
MPTVSVVIPAYNEHESIEGVIERVLAAPLLPGFDREVVVVDDGSVDRTWERLQRFAHRADVQIHRSATNAGKGSALRIGIERARGDVVLVQDADMEYDPDDYPKLLAPIASGQARVVYGSRFLGSIRGMEAKYWLANRILALLVRVIYGFPITDEATAYKVFDAKLLKGIPLECRGFEFCPEVTAKLLRAGERIVEVPIRYEARTVAQGKKIRWRDAAIAAWTLVKYRSWSPAKAVR